MSKKKDALNLKGPDAFQVRAADSVEYLKANSKLVIGLVSALAISAVSVIAFDYISESQLVGRQVALSAVDQSYAKEAKSFDDKKSELEKELDDLKLKNKEKKTAKLEASIAAQQKKLDALSKPNHDASAEGYRGVYENHQDSAQGMVAGIQYAAILAEKNKLSEAKAVLSKISSSSKKYPVLKAQSGLLLLSILEDLGELDQALAHVDSLANTVGKDLKPRVLLSKGRILYLKKDLAGASKVFDELIASYDNSQEAEKARSLKALLN